MSDDPHPPELLNDKTPVPEPESPPEAWEGQAPDLTTDEGAEAALEQFIAQPTQDA